MKMKTVEILSEIVIRMHVVNPGSEKVRKAATVIQL